MLNYQRVCTFSNAIESAGKLVSHRICGVEHEEFSGNRD
jgi:hypothetical protein